MTHMIPVPEAYFRKFIPPRDKFFKSLEKESEKETRVSVWRQRID